MPPRYTYWTILAGGQPTAFRAKDRKELLSTFKQIRRKQPDAEIKWFARGRLWESPEDVLREKPFGQKSKEGRSEKLEDRGRNWRPGGNHRDPRQAFKDIKKSRNQKRRQTRWEHEHRNDETNKPETTKRRERLTPDKVSSQNRLKSSKGKSGKHSRTDLKEQSVQKFRSSKNLATGRRKATKARNSLKSYKGDWKKTPATTRKSPNKETGFVHLVLFTPRPNLTSVERTALVESFNRAIQEIPSVKRARVGQRVVTGRPYEKLMKQDYDYFAVLEFDNRAGFEAYLEHPVHAELSERFFSAFQTALMYDYEIKQGKLL